MSAAALAEAPRAEGAARAASAWPCAVVTFVLAVVVGFVGWYGQDQGILHGVVYTDWNHSYNDADLYAHLADSFLEGRLWLDLEVAPELGAMEDPYDYDARYEWSGEDAPVFWDYAFANGRYYSYFGAVPALLLYAPYRLVTGQPLDTVVAVGLLGIAYVCASALLVWRVAEHWFPRLGGLARCLAIIGFFAGGDVVYLVSVPRFYSVPILCGLVFVCLGLWAWVGALPNRHRTLPKHAAASADGLSWPRLLLGSACLALVLGCRPQLCASWVLAFPLFWEAVFFERTLFSRRSIAQSVAVLAPFALVALAVGLYNYARFGSPLDFGSAYNLTGFDMTTYEQPKSLTANLVAMMLVWPVNFLGQFPFIEPTVYDPAWPWAPHEPLFGGYVWIVPTTWFILGAIWARRELSRRRLLRLVPILVALSVVVCAVDVSLAGVSQRYLADFAWALSLATVISLFGVLERSRERALEAEGAGSASWFVVHRAQLLCALFALLLFVSFCLGLASLLSPEHWGARADVWLPLLAGIGLPVPLPAAP